MSDAATVAPGTALEDGYADLEGLRLHYVSAGDGPLILCLHGFPQFWYLWRAQLEELSADHRVVAPDLRGYNLSGKPEGVESYRMRHLLGDIRGLVDHLGADRFTLVGHDWGGIVSWAFAIKHPELLERLAILDAPPPFTWGRELRENAEQREHVGYMVEFAKPAPGPEEMLSANDLAALDAFLVDPGIERGYLTESDRAIYHQAWSQPGALTGGLNYYRAARMGDQVAAGGVPEEYEQKFRQMRVDVPTLVMWGEEDPALLTGLLDGLDRWIPDLRVETFPGAGHWTPQERAADVNRLIGEFVS
jgi:epoxide hydrolase 4